MTAVNLTVEVHCHRPNWAFNPRINYPTSVYRLYVNKDLLTERTWIWNNSAAIIENIWIHTETNSSHTLTIEPILFSPTQAIFKLDNLQVIDTRFTVDQINEHTISFTLQ